MLQQVLDSFALQSGSSILDCTLGMGGHTRALLECRADINVLGVERDPAARTIARENLYDFHERVEVFEGTFATAAKSLIASNKKFDFILADLGVSSLQIDDMERGFAIRSDSPLDMRMGAECAESALQLIERLSEEELANVIYRYGEERLSRHIAPAIQRAVKDGQHSGKEIAAVIRAVVRGHQKRHPALRTFQALRIAINDELGQLEGLLSAMPKLLRAGGVGVVISFHSLEDRLVKDSYRSQLSNRNNPDRAYSAISKKVLTANALEVSQNKRAHSAKLRWAKRQEEQVSCA
ncbi:MAG: 16S rRNA (cytosine(1402)-N(4))-methyltransferase RsmH [Planctomycetes bacterium]|nr:16S rRNA (cytosine(1402)-N(4))-methyltransferase RsmH [Planctomycetota bacterium]